MPPPVSHVDLSALNGTNGSQFNGALVGDRTGASVASAGDINGDGFDDFIIGAYSADPNGGYSGAAYVVFGTATGFAAEVNLSTLNGTTGFKINGEAAYDLAGVSVSAAGDINGDGFDDIIVGAGETDAGGLDSGAA
jgi:hypothetical protein